MHRFTKQPKTQNKGSFSLSLKSSKVFAFTLAEVLITLTIIGVIAAMTIPTLMTNNLKQQTVVQLKATYNLIVQAVKIAEIEHGELENWDFSLTSAEFNEIYIKPYFKIAKIYKNSDFDMYGLDKKAHDDAFSGHKTQPKLVLANGTMLTIQRNKSLEDKPFVTFIVDINEFKKPNMLGRDIFVFSIQPDIGLVPYGIGNVHGGTALRSYDRADFLSTSEYRNCNRSKYGAFCAAVIMMDGWQIKEDYPW